MDDHKVLEELKNDENELGKKITSLNLIITNSSNHLTYDDVEMLFLQHSTMISYRRVLNIRIKKLTDKLSGKLNKH